MDSWFLLAIVASVAAYFAFQYFRLRGDIDALSQSLLSTPTEAPEPLPEPRDAEALAPLRRAIANTLAESLMLRDSERKQREFQEALLNEIKDAIFILDLNREIRFVNKAGQLLFPSDQPYRSRAFFDVCRDHRVYDTLDLAMEVGAKISDHITMRLSDGKLDRLRERTLLVEAEPLSFDPRSGNGGSWILMKDISAELETEQIRRDFVANASHELRTPLSIINGYLETMDDETVEIGQPLYRRAIRTMRKHGERIARIIEDMLSISKLEGAPDLLARETFDLRDPLEEMVRQLSPIIEANHARIIVTADPEADWSLVGDRFYWDQIFFNLIENALKQNPDPGLRIDIVFTHEEGRIVIQIHDDGIGIPAADLPLVFKRFYRVQKHHAQTQVKGTGLGLSIVKRAVEAHHGRIEVASRPGIRTTFTISVPQSQVRTGEPVGSDNAEA